MPPRVCPSCGYNMKGVEQLMCSECGGNCPPCFFSFGAWPYGQAPSVTSSLVGTFLFMVFLFITFAVLSPALGKLALPIAIVVVPLLFVLAIRQAFLGHEQKPEHFMATADSIVVLDQGQCIAMLRWHEVKLFNLTSTRQGKWRLRIARNKVRRFFTFDIDVVFDAEIPDADFIRAEIEKRIHQVPIQ